MNEFGDVYYLYANRQNLGRSGATKMHSGVSGRTTSPSSSTSWTNSRSR